MQYAGRVEGGDLKFTFNNTVDDPAYLVNTTIKTALTNYTGSLVAVQGETIVIPSSQTLTSTTDNNQSVAPDTAIEPMIFTWGGDATDATVTGLPASGINYVKDATTKTITISGTPTANISFAVTTSGSTGTPVSLSGTITLTTGGNTPSDVVHNFTLSGKTSTFFNITGNLSTSYGTASYDGLTLTQCLKMETSTNISFTTTEPGTLTLVFGSSYTGTINVDGTIISPSGGIITRTLAAGTHTILKGSGTNNLFYMKLVYNNSTGINNPMSKDITIYPNPVSDKLFFSTKEEIQKVEIFTLTGQKIYHSERNISSLDVSHLDSGNYLLKLFTREGIFSKLIIKK
jgi:pectate lyase